MDSFFPCWKTTITFSGISNARICNIEKTNCVRCGAPVMSYQTDCEYCGKTLKEKIKNNKPQTPVSG